MPTPYPSLPGDAATYGEKLRDHIDEVLDPTTGTFAPQIVQGKGDLLAGTAAGQVGRLAVGATGQVLTVDPTTNTLFRWVDLPAKDLRRHYGAIGDGTSHTINAVYGSLAAAQAFWPSWSAVTGLAGTDEVDYAAWQAAWNDHATWGTLRTGKGMFLINKKVVEPITYGKIVQGGGREDTVIKQITDNTPVIETMNEESHSIVWRDLHLTYANQQTSLHPNSTAFALWGDATPLTYGSYWRRWQNLRITQAYMGIATTAGTAMPWGSVFDDILMGSIQHQALKIAPPGGGGTPSVTVNNLQVHNPGASLAATGIAVEIAATEVLLNSLDIEGWHNTAVYFHSGTVAVVNNPHIENHRMTSNFQPVWQAADGPVAINGGTTSIFDVNVANFVTFFKAFGAAKLTVNGHGRVVLGITAGSASYLSASSPATVRFIDNYVAGTSQPIAYPCLDWDTTTLARIKQLNEWLAPVPPATFAVGDTTPSVRVLPGGVIAETNSFKFANTAPTSITFFDDGLSGHLITVQLDANTTLVNSATLKLAGAVNLVGTADDVVMLMFDGTTWRQVAPAAVN